MPLVCRSLQVACDVSDSITVCLPLLRLHQHCITKRWYPYTNASVTQRIISPPSSHPYASFSFSSTGKHHFTTLVRLDVRPSLYIRPSLDLRSFARPSVRSFVCPSVHPTVRPYVRPSLRPSVRLSIRPSIRLSVSPAFC